LPQLYKLLEKQLPELCTTEAWSKRTHWAGLPATPEVFEVVQRAELDLKEKRPVRRCISFFDHDVVILGVCNWQSLHYMQQVT